MSLALKQSTASQEIPLGYFVDSTDGNTEETGLTIANTDIKLWKNGATTLANKNSGGATHISNGVYYAVLDATDTNTVGPMVVFVHVSGALAVRVECHVYEEAIYDALFGASATGLLPANVTQWNSTALSTTNPLPNAAAGANGGLPTVNASNYIAGMQGTINTLDSLDTAQDSQHATTQANQTTILARIGSFTGSGVNTILGFFQALMRSDATTPSDVGGTYDDATDSLQAIRDRGDAAWTTGAGGSAPTAGEIADAVWDEALSGHTTAGTAGKAVSDIEGDTNELQGDWTNGGRLDLLLDAVKAVTDAIPDSGALTTINGNVDAIKVITDALTAAGAANLALSAAGIIGGTAQTGTLSTTVMTTDLTGYANDELIGRVVVWTGGTADGQASEITDYASASGTVTYTAITTAPANGDTFVIV